MINDKNKKVSNLPINVRVVKGLVEVFGYYYLHITCFMWIISTVSATHSFGIWLNITPFCVNVIISS